MKNGPPSINLFLTFWVNDNCSAGASSVAASSCVIVATVAEDTLALVVALIVPNAIKPAMARIENNLFIVLDLNFIS